MAFVNNGYSWASYDDYRKGIPGTPVSDYYVNNVKTEPGTPPPPPYVAPPPAPPVTPAPPPAPTPAGATADQVSNLYRTILQREPSAGEVDMWVKGGIPLDQMTGLFNTSPEKQSLPTRLAEKALAEQKATAEATAKAKAIADAQAIADLQAKADADKKAAEQLAAEQFAKAEADRIATAQKQAGIITGIGTEAQGIISGFQSQTEADRLRVESLANKYLEPVDTTVRSEAEKARLSAETEQVLTESEKKIRNEAALRGGLYGGGYLGAQALSTTAALLAEKQKYSDFQNLLAVEKQKREEVGLNTVIDLYKTHTADIERQFQIAYNIAIEKAKMAQQSGQVDAQAAWEQEALRINTSFQQTMQESQQSATFILEQSKLSSVEKMQQAQITSQEILEGKKIISTEKMQQFEIIAQDIIEGKRQANQIELQTMQAALQKELLTIENDMKLELTKRAEAEAELDRELTRGEGEKAREVQLRIAAMDAKAKKQQARAEKMKGLFSGIGSMIGLALSGPLGKGVAAAVGLKTG